MNLRSRWSRSATSCRRTASAGQNFTTSFHDQTRAASAGNCPTNCSPPGVLRHEAELKSRIATAPSDAARHDRLRRVALLRPRPRPAAAAHLLSSLHAVQSPARRFCRAFMLLMTTTTTFTWTGAYLHTLCAEVRSYATTTFVVQSLPSRRNARDLAGTVPPTKRCVGRCDRPPVARSHPGEFRSPEPRQAYGGDVIRAKTIMHARRRDRQRDMRVRGPA